MYLVYRKQKFQICDEIKKRNFSFNKDSVWVNSVKDKIESFSNNFDENLFTKESKLLILLENIKRVD